MPARIVPRLAAEWRALPGGTFTPCRHGTTIAVAIIQIMMDVAIEAFGSAIPRTRADEHAA